VLFGVRVVVVVPAYAEQERIADVLRGLPPFVDRAVVVDDASPDATSEAAERVGDARVSVVRHPRNLGVGAAIVTGYRHALREVGSQNDAFVVMAGDGQMDPNDLPALVAPIACGEAGYAKGNRFSHRDAAVMPLGRRIGGEVFSRATSLAIGQRVRDSQCGYTAIARWACERLDFGALWSGYGYPNDWLGSLARSRVPIAEVVVRPIYAGEASGLRLRHLPRIGWLVARSALRRAIRP
jgi:glycosyltransferase involved in cell wall biosynthesis